MPPMTTLASAGSVRCTPPARTSDADQVAFDEGGVDPGIERLAAALEREAIGVGGLGAARDHRRADAGIEPALADDLAERHRGFEVAAAPDVEHHRRFVRAEAIEEREQPLERVPLHDAFGGDPVGAMAPQASSPPCAA